MADRFPKVLPGQKLVFVLIFYGEKPGFHSSLSVLRFHCFSQAFKYIQKVILGNRGVLYSDISACLYPWVFRQLFCHIELVP